MAIKKNDVVRIITGSDKGKTGSVIEISLKKGKVKVEGVAMAIHHARAQRQGEKSAIKSAERFIDISNIEKV